MQSSIMHNANMLARTVFYCFWIWIFYFNGLDLSFASQSFLNCLVLADIITWVVYQFYLLPRMMVQFSFGSIINLVVIVLLMKDAQSLIPESLGMQAMAIMVFFSVAAVKGFYYVLIEMDGRRSRSTI